MSQQCGAGRRAARSRTGRALALGTAAVFSAIVLLVGCGSSRHGSGSSADAAAAVSSAVVIVTPGDGAAEVPAEGGVGVSVSSGRLSQVQLKDDKGMPVPGAVAADGASWKPTTTLMPATRYTLDAIATDSGGLQAAKHVTFTTFVPRNTFIAFYTPEDGSTVGVGMEVSLHFNRDIADRATVQRAVQVTAKPSVPIAGHWFGAKRLDFRPEHYWKPGTRVLLSLRFKGVEGAPGVYGTQDKQVSFTVGREQTSTADAAADTLTVRRGGQVLRTLLISAGGPGHDSYNGIMVISEMYRVTRMNSRSVGLGSEYDIPAVPHAMRLTDSGTFVHGVFWRPASVFGSQNTSHGCIGLHDTKGGGDSTPAGWFFDHSMPGDVVVVVGSHGDAVAPDNGMSGWNLPWARWLASSAHH